MYLALRNNPLHGLVTVGRGQGALIRVVWNKIGHQITQVDLVSFLKIHTFSCKQAK